MTKKHQPLFRGTLSSALALAALATNSPAATTAQIEPVIVSAMRFPQPSSTVTSSVTSLDPAELHDQGITQLRDALNLAPGVIALSTAGQTGAVGSLFVRGFTTSKSLMVVDGIRMNGSSNQLGNFFTTARTRDIGMLEVLRGPQSAAYGGESMGGVIWSETPRGSGDPTTRVGFEAGAFDSLSGFATFQGEVNGLSCYLTGGYEETENDADDSFYRQGSTALRVEAPIDDIWTLGTTFRLNDNFYENGGSSKDRFDSTLNTIYANGRISDIWTSRYTIGHRQESYDNVSQYPLSNDLESTTLSSDHEILIHDNLRLISGGFVQMDSFEQIAFQNVDLSSDLYGIYSALEWDVTDKLTTSTALRWEDYDAYGDEVTWKFGSVYRIESTGTRLRGSVGTAFQAPTYLNLFYENSSGTVKGNPNLNSEKSLGWDLGIEQSIGKNHTVDVTYFRNLIDDAIDTSKTTPVNKTGTSATDGLEVGITGTPFDSAISYRLAWTYLHESFSDQPKNAGTATVQWQATEKSIVGIGATHRSTHSWGGNDISPYTVARVFASHQLTERVKLHTRVENALNENYLLSNFSGSAVEGAGTGAYFGIEIEW